MGSSVMAARVCMPNDKFGKSYGDRFIAAMTWIFLAERTQFVTPSGQH